MKKLGVLIVTFIVIIVLNFAIYNKDTNISCLSLANVEALANDEFINRDKYDCEEISEYYIKDYVPNGYGQYNVWGRLVKETDCIGIGEVDCHLGLEVGKPEYLETVDFI